MRKLGWQMFEGEIDVRSVAIDAGRTQMKRIWESDEILLAEGQHFVEPLRFTGCSFPNGLNLSRCVFEGPVVFKNCVFYGDVKLNDSKCRASIHFKKCLFLPKSESSYDDALVDLHRSRFKGYVSFRGCFVAGHIEAHGASFAQGFIFRKHIDILLDSSEPYGAASEDAKRSFGSCLKYGCGAYSLNLSDALIHRDLDLGGIYVRDSLNLGRCQVEGSLKITYIPRFSERQKLKTFFARFSSEEDPNVDSLKEGPLKMLLEGQRSFLGGAIDLHNMKVARNLSMRGTTCGRNIEAPGLEVGGRLALRPNRHIMELMAPAARDERRQYFQTLVLGTVRARHARVGVLDLRGAVVRRTLDLQGLITDKVNIEPYPLKAVDGSLDDARSQDTHRIKSGETCREGTLSKDVRTPILARFADIDLSNSEIRGDFLAPCLRARSLYARSCRICGSVNLRTRDGNEGGRTRIGKGTMRNLPPGMPRAHFSIWMPDSFVGGYFAISGGKFASCVDLARSEVRGKVYLHSFGEQQTEVGIGVLPSGDMVSIFLDGAKIIGSIWADGLKCSGMLDLRRATLADLDLRSDHLGRPSEIGWLRLSGAIVMKDITLAGCVITEALIAESMDLRGSLSIRPSLSDLCAYGLHIKSENAPPGKESESVSQKSDLYYEEEAFSAWLKGSKIHGSLYAESARFERGLFADNMQIEGNCVLRGALSEGKEPEALRIGEGFLQSGQCFSIGLCGARLRSGLFMAGVMCTGGVDLAGSQISKDILIEPLRTPNAGTLARFELNCFIGSSENDGASGPRSYALWMRATQVKGQIKVLGTVVAGGICLIDAKIDGSVTIGEAWLEGDPPKSRLPLYTLGRSPGSSLCEPSQDPPASNVPDSAARGTLRPEGALTTPIIVTLPPPGRPSVGEDASRSRTPDKTDFPARAAQRLASLVGRSKHSLRTFGVDLRNAEVSGPINLSGLILTAHATKPEYGRRLLDLLGSAGRSLRTYRFALTGDDASAGIGVGDISSRTLASSELATPFSSDEVSLLSDVRGQQGLRCDLLLRGCKCGEIHIGAPQGQRHKEHLNAYINGNLDASGVEVRGSVSLNSLFVMGLLRLPYARIGGEMQVRGSDEGVNVLGLRYGFEGEPEDHGPERYEPVDMTSLRVGGSLDLTAFRGPGIALRRSQVEGALILDGACLYRAMADRNHFSLRMTNARLGSFQARGLTAECGISFVGAVISGDVDLSGSKVHASEWQPENKACCIIASGAQFGLDVLLVDTVLYGLKANEVIGPSIEASGSAPPGLKGLSLEALNFEGAAIARDCSLVLSDLCSRPLKISCRRATVSGTLEIPVDFWEISHDFTDAHIGRIRFLVLPTPKEGAESKSLSSYGGVIFSEFEFLRAPGDMSGVPLANAGLQRRRRQLNLALTWEIFAFMVPWLAVGCVGYAVSSPAYEVQLTRAATPWMGWVPAAVFILLLARLGVTWIDLRSRDFPKDGSGEAPEVLRRRCLWRLGIEIGSGLTLTAWTILFPLLPPSLYGEALILPLVGLFAAMFAIRPIVKANLLGADDRFQRYTAHVQLTERRYAELTASLALVRSAARSTGFVQRIMTRFDSVGARSMADYLYIVGRNTELTGHGPGALIEEGVRAISKVTAKPYIIFNLFFANIWLVILFRLMIISNPDLSSFSGSGLPDALRDVLRWVFVLGGGVDVEQRSRSIQSALAHAPSALMQPASPLDDFQYAGALSVSVIIARVLLVMLIASIAGSLSMMNRRQRQVGI